MYTIFSEKLRYQFAVFITATFLVSSSANAKIDIAQQPLLVSKPVPSNVAIIGSFEYPTMVTKAYKGDSQYTDQNLYIGYFDNQKCYKYHYEDEESKRHFYPVSKGGPRCAGDDLWSGNFLNWATMQTIDIFRHALTGGHRSTDEVGTTILEKGIQTGQGKSDTYPDGEIRWSTGDKNRRETITNATPMNWDNLRTRIGWEDRNMGVKLLFIYPPTTFISPRKIHDPAYRSILGYRFPSEFVFELSVRVKVCVEGLLEDNCVKQPNGKFKPEGLIQQYAEIDKEHNIPNMRFSAFDYLNDPKDITRKGGVMRARMKYVSPFRADKNNLKEEKQNPNREWNRLTGEFIKNPDKDDLADTVKEFPSSVVKYSGVINYINRSGSITENTKYKKHDHVSELYYAAYRYMKGLNNIPSYTNLDLLSSGVTLEQLTGGLPVITDWKKNDHDPIQFYCQKNFFLGIGDTDTPDDRDLSINTDDPLFKTSLPSSKSLFDNLKANMFDREKSEYKATQKSNIAVLAYDANTSDIRPDDAWDEMQGKQSISTHWIDIVERSLQPKSLNPYWMAAKYGGFKVPEIFIPLENKTALDEPLWWTPGNMLSPSYKRPDNFYIASEPEEMIDSLTRAFANLQASQRGGSSSLALSSNRLEPGSKAFKTQYVSGGWSGDLEAYKLDEETGIPASELLWNAESMLPGWDQRKVYVNIDNELKDFKTNGKDLKGFDQDKVNFLLGNREEENSSFRVRQGVLGDIVNSQPIFIGKPKADLFRRKSFVGAGDYRSWAKDTNRTPVVYVGGNDGMLHGFNADTGEEVFAFIPKTVIENGLSELTNKNYNHRYFVDGDLTVADAYISTVQNPILGWKTILVGTLGAGGIDESRKTTNNAVFALDVTDPGNVSLLWEKDSSDIPQLGINSGKPIIIQTNDTVHDKRWKVVLGNGPNSTDDTASLISIDIATGTASALAMSNDVNDVNDVNNGLSAIRAWDNNGNGLTDTIYAGDMLGTVWKVTNLTAETPTKTSIFKATAKAGTTQPITTTILAGKSPQDTVWLFFGTGQYLNTTDLINTDMQSWYGIKDNGTSISRTDLIEREIPTHIAVPESDDIAVSSTIQRSGLSDAVLQAKEGWYIDFETAGERMVVPNIFDGQVLVGTMRTPNANDPCAPSGTGRMMAITPFIGKHFAVSSIRSKIGSSAPVFMGGTMYTSKDDGTSSTLKTSDFSSDTETFGSDINASKKLQRTSWRELMNPED